jgi:hypothetical protein
MKPKPAFRVPGCSCILSFTRRPETKSGHLRKRYVRSSGFSPEEGRKMPPRQWL